MLLVLAVLILLGGFHWYLVFSDSARRRHNAAHWHFWRRSKEGRELDNDLTLATSLIIAVTCSTLLVVIVIFSLVQLFT